MSLITVYYAAGPSKHSKMWKTKNCKCDKRNDKKFH
jgi:hypothetical protein